ncbi:MAG: MBL fold metallo-hydrolase [Armatimonadetes bacterium]|nr:MBL fold metallo-hydrolase [Armatimonadota bacterium]
MIIRNFYDEKLAQASYLVGCAATGEAIVIDPLRDIEQYIAMANAQNLRITAVTETHIHADFLSGTRELSAATGATMYLSDEGDDLWKYAFADDPKAVLMKDGFVIKVGNLTLKAVHTPGHTPEHMSYLLTDHPAGETPHSFFTGDFVFIGDVGRPDLLERAANFVGTMEKGARVLYGSLEKIKDLPDSLLVWPAHGAGSACGKSLGGSPVSSLGYERKTNWAFQINSEEKFVDEVLSGQPEPPYYFKEMKRLNKIGPTVLGSMPNVPAKQVAEGPLVDVRSAATVRGNYYQGSLAIPSGKGLTNWAGWLLKYDEPVTLIAESQAQANQAARDMATIGLDVVAGWIDPVDLDASKFAPFEETTCQSLDGTEIVLDVRGINEWRNGHVNSSMHIPLGYLRERLNELPRDRKIVVHCASGGRSPIGVSILKQAGFEHVAEIAGGITDITLRCPTSVVTA